MARRAIYAVLAISAALSTGCTGPPARHHTVPFWKGIPAQLLSPDSQEAYAWRHPRRPRRGEPYILPQNPYRADPRLQHYPPENK
jgi:hypothetical protein